MQKRLIFTNAFMSVLQIIVNGIILFFLYRVLLKSLGPEQLGIWSLVLATTSLINVANFGLSGSVVKFVAKYLARKENENASKVIQTASISVAIFIGLALLIAYPVIRKILGIVVVSESLHSALLILPFSLLSLLLNSITGVFQSGLDGAQRIYLRNLLSMISAFLYFALCLIFVPLYGLKGAAYSQVLQSGLILFSSWLILKKVISELPLIPTKWDKSIFKEIISYGMNFQLISVISMFYDPITKALLSRFGSLSMVGYYEMANRMVQQFRALIVAANQVLVPFIADLQEKTPKKIKDIYLTSYQLLFYLSLPMYTSVLISLPLISRVWIGHYEETFIIFGILVTVGWFLNTLNVPAYFVNLGTGALKWNVYSHITVGLFNAGLGFLFGFLFNGIGVVTAWVLSLSLGSSLVYISYHLKNKIPLKELIPESSRAIFFICVSCVVLSFLFLQKLNICSLKVTIFSNILAILLFCIVILIPLYLHPLRRQLIGWGKELMNKKAGA
ncbi:MAG: oligosaccharide flippase family protein [candidate division WOR-3 bacterium]